MAPARWQSSQRPLLVRTVWMDGQRHAVLSADDPALQYLSSSNSPSGGRFVSVGSASPPNSPPPQPPGRPPAATDNDLKHCLVKLQLLRSRARARTAAPDAPSATRRPPSPPRALASQRSDCDERSAPYDQEALGARHLMIGRYRRPYLPCIFRCRSTSSDSSEDPDDPFFDADGWLPHVEAFLPELQMNPLSERVLQWLDLAGRGPLVASGTAKAMPAPPGRSPATPPRRPPPSAWSRSKCRPSAVALAPQTPPTPLPMAEPSLRCRPCGRSLVDPVSSGSSPDSPPPPAEALLVNARGFSAHRRPSFALCNVAVSPPVPPSPPVSPPCPSPSIPPQSPDQPHPTPVMQAFMPPPQPAYTPRYSGGGRGAARPQLHIFLPALPHERRQLLLQEMESDTESLWSEA